MSVKITFQVSAQGLPDLVMETSRLLEILPTPGTTLTMAEDHTVALIEVEWDDAEQTVAYFEGKFAAGPE